MAHTLRFSATKIAAIIVVCLAACYFALPNLLPPPAVTALKPVLPEQRLNLGLDLLGGSHLLLEIDREGYRAEQLQSLRGSVRQALREEKVGYTELAVVQDRIRVVIRPETVPTETTAEAILREASADVTIEETGANRYQVTFREAAMAQMEDQLMDQTIKIIGQRINETGTREPLIQQQGEGRILLQVPGVENPQQLKEILGKTAKMTFHLVNHQVTEREIMQGDVPLGTMTRRTKPREDQPSYPVALYAEPVLSGEQLIDANATEQDGQPVVSFRFNTQGARIFGEVTQEHIGKQFAIVLDNQIITAPVIRSPIRGGSGIIEGGFSHESAKNLALLLRSGALPTDVTILEERTVGPSLGADSIQAGTSAAIVAIILVAVFMMISYGIFGLFSNLALMMNLLLLVAALSLLQATLTLPGIAGIVLTLGMAVDANVLIFERIREEAARGRTIMAAMEKGFDSAFGTILDSNVTTLIAAFVLFYFGTGTVKGFAVTLSFGILSSMFSAIMLTRLMMVLWLRRGKTPTALPI